MNGFWFTLIILQAEDALKREKNIEEAKQIIIEEDKSLPPAKRVGAVDHLL